MKRTTDRRAERIWCWGVRSEREGGGGGAEIRHGRREHDCGEMLLKVREGMEGESAQTVKGARHMNSTNNVSNVDIIGSRHK